MYLYLIRFLIIINFPSGFFSTQPFRNTTQVWLSNTLYVFRKSSTFKYILEAVFILEIGEVQLQTYLVGQQKTWKNWKTWVSNASFDL